MKKRDKITEIIYQNSTDTSEGMLIRYIKIEGLIDELAAIDYEHSSIQLTDKSVTDFEEWKHKFFIVIANEYINRFSGLKWNLDQITDRYKLITGQSV